MSILSGAKSRVHRRLEAGLITMSKCRSRQGLYEFLEREYWTIPRHAEVLSVGAGGDVNNLLLHVAKQIGFTVTTFDIDADRGPDIVGDICTYDFGTKKFDAVVISEVLEHLASPPLGLKTIHSILKADGRLVLSTPFMLPLHDRPYDYFRFTRYGLELLLKEFRNVRVQERNSYFEAIDVLWVRLLIEKGKSARLASYVIIPLIFYLKRPLSILLGKLVKTDAMTTGYIVTAVR